MKQYSIHKVNNFETWDIIKGTKDFSCASTNESLPETVFRAFYDDNFLHFQFVAFGNNPLVFVDKNAKSEVLQSERVELFFRSDKKMTPYFCLEIDANARIFDYKADYYRNFDYNWKWPEKLNINSQIIEKYYIIEGKLNLQTLKDMNLLKNNKIQIGIFRAHCAEIKENIASFTWISWIDAKTLKPDFHIKSVFGLLKLI